VRHFPKQTEAKFVYINITLKWTVPTFITENSKLNHLQRAHSVNFALSKARACRLASEKALVVLDICVGNYPETYGKHLNIFPWALVDGQGWVLPKRQDDKRLSINAATNNSLHNECTVPSPCIICNWNYKLQIKCLRPRTAWYFQCCYLIGWLPRDFYEWEI